MGGFDEVFRINMRESILKNSIDWYIDGGDYE